MTDRTETPETTTVGTRIYNHGDMANVPHFATIMEKVVSTWGTTYTLKTDARSHPGRSFTYKIRGEQISPVYEGTGMTRFVTEAEYDKHRTRKIAEFKAAHARLGR